jgi:hypothetical protein
VTAPRSCHNQTKSSVRDGWRCRCVQSAIQQLLLCRSAFWARGADGDGGQLTQPASPRPARRSGYRPASYLIASSSSRQACSQRRQASARTRQCSCILACRSHSSPQLLHAAAQTPAPRTVQCHLGKVFTKLGISSRRQLHRVYPSTRIRSRGANPRRLASRTASAGPPLASCPIDLADTSVARAR